jgi:hypothetical protein
VKARARNRAPYLASDQIVVSPMFQRLLLFVVIPFGLVGGALAEPSKLAGEVLRQAVSGKTVLI